MNAIVVIFTQDYLKWKVWGIGLENERNKIEDV